jgi:hypothetical protein
MKRLARLLALVLSFGAAVPLLAAGQTSTVRTTRKAPARKTKAAAKPTTTKASVPRDAKGRIARSEAARHAFARQTGYPNGRPGYVVDHIVPLTCGGADRPSNMQWQTVAAAKLKDKTERPCYTMH